MRGDAEVVLDGLVTVVDSGRAQSLAENDLALEQIAYADVVVLSRPEAGDAQAFVERRNPLAVVAEADRGNVDLQELLARRRADFARDVPSTVHDEGLESVALEGGELDEDRFGDFVEQTLGAFSGRLLRVKGIVAIAGLEPRMILQGVADTMEVTFGAPFVAERRSRLVIIGFGLDRDGFEAAFRACQAASRKP
jgi:G3E family GTPase